MRHTSVFISLITFHASHFTLHKYFDMDKTMPDAVQLFLNDFARRIGDRRLNVFDVKAEEEMPGQVGLSGRILDEAFFNELRSSLESHFPAAQFDFAGVCVLRKSPPRILTVSTNLSGLYAGPSWQAEMLSQVFYGWKLELLEENGSWAFVRLVDGYLGWVYRPYLTESPSPDPTHLVIAPATYVRGDSSLSSPIVGRFVCGTPLQVVKWNGLFAEIDAQVWGWVTASELRAFEDLPKTPAERRGLISSDAARLTGVPYLQGGCSAMGIDASGYSHLLHRLVGVRIPRDADLQFEAGRKIEPPYQVGDLLFFDKSGQNHSATHVAVSLGGWRIIHASQERNGVYYDDVQDVDYLKKNFLGACTFL
jgi:hypothetical protein